MTLTLDFTGMARVRLRWHDRHRLRVAENFSRHGANVSVARGRPGRGGDLGIEELDQVVGHTGEERRPRCGREQRIGDEVVAATIDAAVKGVHDETPLPTSHCGGRR
jgi:hypothetical protein